MSFSTFIHPFIEILMQNIAYLGQFGMCLKEIEFGVQKIAAELIPKPGFPRCLCKSKIKLF